MVVEAPLGSAGAGLLTDLGQGASQQLRPAQTSDVERFQTAMATPPADLLAPPEAPEPSAQSAVYLQPVEPQPDLPAPPVSLGQTILDGMNSLRGQFDSQVNTIRDTLTASGSDLTLQQMMSIQMQISTLSVQQDLMGKIVGKATQNVDQLLKAQ
ncbi:EscI/YscI/HrpB family type III secretion system inner rod protein [Telmatospirillum sp. J64-1]|uniref:EscI/YscI/HrpB family type III secretion system inner rod protein n=1 Tax=Telmatospirillum sp. J64-1 TaxID=2502183 RepID=UPI00163D4271|nr:EscI/YscI/HrpB family type III secretion system inner rod protein [Telmatospirillum sp. J64-1]